MKTSRRLTALFLLAATGVFAAQLAAPAAVHTKPDQTAPTLTYLKAGTVPTPAPNASAPAGWQAVEIPGPFEGYVENKDLTKSLDVRAGASIRFEPKLNAGVLAIATASDKTSITGIRGKWTQISLEKNLVGYLRMGEATARPAPSPAPTAPASPPAPAPVAPPPVAPGVYGVATPGQPVAMVNLGDGGSSSLPRQFAGKFVSTRRPFTPRRPYDYALNDDSGRRFAFLDVSKLLQTDQIEKYLDLPVVVYGTARNGPEGRDIIIQVETLQLK
jgi:hypothetical protein